MRRYHLFVIVALAGLVISAGARAESAEEAIEKQLDTFQSAFNAGDAKAVAELYTEDAVILPPDHERISGRESIAEFWQGAIDAGLKDLELEPIEIVAHGDAAHEMSTLRFTMPSEEGEQTVEGKYIIIWTKGEDGTWRLHRDIWNMNPAQTE